MLRGMSRRHFSLELGLHIGRRERNEMFEASERVVLKCNEGSKCVDDSKAAPSDKEIIILSTRLVASSCYCESYVLAGVVVWNEVTIFFWGRKLQLLNLAKTGSHQSGTHASCFTAS